MSKILQLVAFTKEDVTNTDMTINFGNIPNYFAQEINRITGIKVSGLKKVLSVYGIKHTLESHSDKSKEDLRGQVGVEDTDFEFLPDILSNPDKIEVGNNKRGAKSIVFIKKHKNQNIYHAAMYRTNDDIRLATLYIKKKTGTQMNTG